MYTWPELPIFGGYKPYELSEFRAFELAGDSMPPYKDGAIAVCEKLKDVFSFEEGKPHIVVHTCGITYRNIYKDGDTLLCRADNTDYPDFYIAGDTVKEIWKPYHILAKMPN